MSKRTLSHALVSKEPLSNEERKVISNFYVANIPKHHGNSRSSVWNYFGWLMYSQGTGVEGEDAHDSPIPGTSSSSQPSKRVKLGENNYYCKLCLEGEQKKFASKGLPGRIQNVKKYSVKTATTCMADHVKLEHNIDPSQLSQDGKRQKLLFTTTGSEASCYSGTAGTNAQFEFSRRITLWFARDLVSFEEIYKACFQDFFAYYLPKLSVPSSTTLCTGALLDV